ncbi:MAG TPA: hypothetical protein VHF22_08020, partial [Planctomycetota bacterium]|nr:hypothetical protein [Planctomycetota bacterium]
SAGRAVEIDDARADLAWSVRYRACDGRLVLTVSRAAARAQAPLVVSVPAGSYGISSAGSQDLGLLRAPVIVLRAGETSTSASAPVACASFDRTGPGNGEDYELARFERGSPIDRLMVALCSGATAPEQAGQLAVWVVRNGLTRSQLAGEPFAMTFENHLFVSEANAPDAADVIRRAGLDVGKLRFFDGLRLQRKEPATPPPAPRRAPAPRPEPGANLS